MKRKIILIVVSIVLILLSIITILVIKNYKKVENLKDEDNATKKGVEIKDKIKTEETKEEPSEQEKLYITFAGNTFTAYTNKQDYKYIDSDNTPEEIKSEVKNNFDSWWDEIDSPPVTLTRDRAHSATFQLSRYGYPKNDLDFWISKRIIYHEKSKYNKVVGGTFIFYEDNQANNKVLRLSEHDLGRNIYVYRINSKWYAFKVIVTE